MTHMQNEHYVLSICIPEVFSFYIRGLVDVVQMCDPRDEAGAEDRCDSSSLLFQETTETTKRDLAEPVWELEFGHDR